ncbi:MAG: DUF1127 domain-containing protein [Desulfobulbia bacterium]
MSTYEEFSNTHYEFGIRRTGVIWRIFGNFFLKIREHIREQSAITQLQELDDKLLRDIGIDRSEIRVAVLAGRKGVSALRHLRKT